MAIKIYTKTGDSGQTSLIGGTKVPKSHIRIEAYGTVDELNSWIGLLNDHFSHERTRLNLRDIQDRLFTIGSSLAADPDKKIKLSLPDLRETDVRMLEKEIDILSDQLPELKSFLLPGGHMAVSTAHITRCVCRRAERWCVAMTEQKLFVEPLVIIYLNRLSDYLFVLSRFIAKDNDVQEIAWKPRIAEK